MKFCIITFGCQMNVCDSNWLHHALLARGWEPAPEGEADVVLVNTCSVREKPEQKVYSQLGRLRRHLARNPGMFVGVGGCVAQQVGEEFWDRFPHVRLVFGPDGVPSVPDSLQRLLQEPGLRISLLDFTEHYRERELVWDSAGAPAQAFVNIMQGCDNFCAYCIVPYTRGRQKSRPGRSVLRECRQLAAAGVKEVTLLGQNVNSYGQDAQGDGTTFAELLREVCSIPGLERVRFTTSHPKDIDPEVIRAFGRYPNLCPSLHLPLQSGSDRILESMGRRYTRGYYLEVVRELRRARPDIVLGTDIIVGFPGETEADLEQTLDLMREAGFDSSFSFKYSDRPGVRAASFPDKVGEDIKAHRLKRVQALQDELTEASLRRLENAEVRVLVEGPGANRNGGSASVWRGREEGGRVVNFRAPEGLDLTGRLVRVSIREAKKHSVFGEVWDYDDRDENIRTRAG
jgi:tRNA-2-methylthio-N6-dimethylallyladenosine synthase